jgi:hypothetical protein
MSPTHCSCTRNRDGSVTTSMCPTHADQDPCLTMAQVTGRRRKGSIKGGVCTSCGHGAAPPEPVSKVAGIEARADKAYEAEDEAWFFNAPLDHLAVLWGIACARDMGASWDDEVFEALDRHGWFDAA